MPRATRRKPHVPAVPRWFTAGGLPGPEEANATAESPDESTSSDDEPMPAAHLLNDLHITEGTLHSGSYPDTLAFLRSLASLNTADLATAASGSSLDAADREAAADLFNWQEDVVVARAPGRLDVMGGIADYSGSLVLQLPLAEACYVAAQLRPTTSGEVALLRIVSLDGRGTDRAPSFEMPLAELLPVGRPLPFAEARAMFADDTARSWAAYVAGTLLVLMHECDARVPPGKHLCALVASDVPPGAGVSSSAALEVASMAAFAAALRLDVQPRQLAILCQKAENWVVGAPCGVMDQMTAALGRRRRLLALFCRPAHLLPSVAIPDNLRFWGVDSGIRHSVGGADYGTVRAAAFMGLALMSAREAAAHPRPAPLDGRPAGPAGVPLIGGGYVCAIAPSLFEQAHSDALPTALSGADFFAAHGRHLDAATTVQPDTRYPVRQCVAHPIYENFRVEAFRTMLQGHPTDTAALLSLGELMFQSHASYGRCGLGSKGTDLLVDLVRREIVEASARSEQPAVFGAKITGGGSGGTVCIIGRADDSGQAAVDRIVAAYRDATQHNPRVFTGSSSGSAAFGHLRVRRMRSR